MREDDLPAVIGATNPPFNARDTTNIPELSIVIPCYNEERNVEAIHSAVKKEAELHSSSYEIIFIDNFSTDDTRNLLRLICASHPETRAIFNNRNYGQMRSPTHAIYQTTGRAVIGMCADFQDPPSMIGPFMAQWRAGAQVVLGQRRSEQAAGLMGLVRKIGYQTLKAIADHPVVDGATGFGLFDRVVVDALSRWNEPEPFFRGMVVESGFRLSVLPVDRPARAAGESKNNWRSLTGFAISGLTGSAKTLLRLPLLLSFPIATISLLLFFIAVFDIQVAGLSFQSILIISIQGGVTALLLFFIGLIGDQVRIIGERSRGVPLVIEEQRINFPAEITTL